MDFLLEAIITGLIMLGANGYAIKWIKGNLDALKNEHDRTMINLAKNYSTTDKMIQMIGLVNAPVQQSIDSLRSEVHDTKADIKSIEEKIDRILLNQGNS